MTDQLVIEETPNHPKRKEIPDSAHLTIMPGGQHRVILVDATQNKITITHRNHVTKQDSVQEIKIDEFSAVHKILVKLGWKPPGKN
tara:strand:- start:28514 stop:28771 length:258 start_codon:yes stop_codon:yes gene_type:complete